MLCVYVHTRHSTCVEVRGQHAGISSLSPSIMWILGLKLGSLGVERDALTHGAISLDPSFLSVSPRLFVVLFCRTGTHARQTLSYWATPQPSVSFFSVPLITTRHQRFIVYCLVFPLQCKRYGNKNFVLVIVGSLAFSSSRYSLNLLKKGVCDFLDTG